jgi:hypothetical protein
LGVIGRIIVEDVPQQGAYSVMNPRKEGLNTMFIGQTKVVPGAPQATSSEFTVVHSQPGDSQPQVRHGCRFRPLCCAALFGTTAIVAGIAGLLLNQYGVAGTQQYGAEVWGQCRNLTMPHFLPW